ncbi:hypothetical protein [Gracilimonas sp.]|uniref:hypothetical protein n=1 Tax=Gracilimonas sp. TaxID=1974203 RepID=UPI00287181AD|nr:hypothetical protein [Gracilimonas sp.]
MKKPKITEGEWYTNSSVFDDTIIVTTKENGWVADVPGSPEQQRANAKVISAVPEMIDALIVAQDVFSYINDNDAYGDFAEELTKVEKALKKAGCYDS